MKKLTKLLILTFTFLLFTFYFAKAQRIHFTDSTNYWITNGVNGDSSAFNTANYYFYTRDTIIGGFMYRSLKDSLNFYYSDFAYYTNNVVSYWVREDTIANLVYVWYNDTDRILYNYNLLIGDTINFNYIVPDNYRYIDILTDTFPASGIPINGIYYKIFTLFEIDTYRHCPCFCTCPFTSTYTILEGIGCMFGPLYPITNTRILQEVLFCFHRQTDTPNFSLYYFDAGSYHLYSNKCAPLAIETITEKKQNIIVAPNPVDKNSVLKFNNIIVNGSLAIYNTFGQEILNMNVNNKIDIPLSGIFPLSGLYYYRIVDIQESKVYYGKILYSP